MEECLSACTLNACTVQTCLQAFVTDAPTRSRCFKSCPQNRVPFDILSFSFPSLFLLGNGTKLSAIHAYIYFTLSIPSKCWTSFNIFPRAHEPVWADESILDRAAVSFFEPHCTRLTLPANLIYLSPVDFIDFRFPSTRFSLCFLHGS